MAGLQAFEPDFDPCAICGAEAAGACAGCHRLICGACAELRPGATGPVAWCTDCIRGGAHSMHWRALASTVLLVVLVAAALLAIVLMLR